MSTLRFRALPAVTLTAALVALPLTAFAQPKAGVTVEGITEYNYPNGFKLLLVPDDSKPTVTVNMTLFVGSRHEGYGETGMAHLLEHMLFKGTPKTPNPTDVLSEKGAEANGTTWLDRTNYFETVKSTPENLAWAIRFEADRMLNAVIAKKDLDTEMTVVRNEFEMGENSPGDILDERTMSTAFLWHNYGKSTIGARADLENVPVERLRAFYKAYYRPDNAMLVVAGKFDTKAALSLVNETFGKMQKPTVPVQKTYTREPVQDGERTVTLRRVGGTQALSASYHIPAGTHPDFAPLDVLSEVLGHTPSGRLHTALVQKKLATQVRSSTFQLREPGVISFGAEVPKEVKMAEPQKIFVETIEGITQKGPTDAEVNRAKESLLKQIDVLLDSSDRVGITLSETAAMGDWRMLFLHRDWLRKVTTQDVHRVAKAYLKPSNRTLGVFVPTDKPDRAEIPEAPDLVKLFDGYKGDAAKSQGEAFDPSPANLEKRIVRKKLPGGMELALLTKKTRGETVNGTLTLRMGSEKSLMGLATAGEFAGDLLMRGTKKHTRQQIQEKLDKLRARLRVRGNADSATASFEVKRPQLEELLTLVTEILREPRFDSKEFEELKSEKLAQFEELKVEPSALASITLTRYVRPRPVGHPHYAMTPDERAAATKALTLEAVRNFHARFYGAAFADMALVGDFDAAAAEAKITKSFDGWKAPEAFTRIPSPYAELPAKDFSIETPDKANAFFMAAQNLKLRDDNADYPALVLANYMMGDGFLSSRLMTRIRQKDGLSYGVGSSLDAHPIEEKGSFGAHAIYAPQNAEKLVKAFDEEIAKSVKSGFTSDEIKKAKSGFLDSLRVMRSQDPMLAGTLAQYLYLGRTFEYDAKFEAALQALTPKQIQTAWAKWIVPTNISTAKAGDFKSPPKGDTAPTTSPQSPTPSK